jgi:hypothetical protein
MTNWRRYLLLTLAIPAALTLRAQADKQGNPVTLTPSPGVIPHNASTEKAVTAATAFMTAIVRDSSIDNLMDLCGLPFCHDDSVVITTRAGLRNALTELLAAAGKQRARTHPQVDSVYVLDIRKETLFGMVPINIYFTVVNLKMTFQGKEASRLFILAVQLTDEARVVGIQD